MISSFIDPYAKRCAQTLGGNRLASDRQDLHHIPPLFRSRPGTAREHLGRRGHPKHTPTSTIGRSGRRTLASSEPLRHSPLRTGAIRPPDRPTLGRYLAHATFNPRHLVARLIASEALDLRVAGVGDRVQRETDQPGGDDAQQERSIGVVG
jgi:hypothetical protein